MLLNEFHEAIFAWPCVPSDRPRALLVITWRGEGCRYMMRLGLTVKMAQLLKIKRQMSSIWAKGCIVMTVCVLSDLT